MTATATKPTFKILDLEITDFLRIEGKLRIPANGQHVRISGENESGKTSVVAALWYLLTGASSKDLPEPVHHGKEKAIVRAKIGDEVVEYEVVRTWTDKGSTLDITAADGSKVRKPQEFLNGLLAAYCLDPVAFDAERPQDQIETVLKVCGVEAPVGDVLTLTGEQHAALSGESAYAYLDRLFGDNRGTYYDRRRQAHLVWEQKRAALEEGRQKLFKSGGPLTGAETETSASGMLKQIEQLQQKADARRAVQDRATEARKEHEDLARQFKSLETQRRIEVQAIEELEEKLKQRRAILQGIDDRVAKGRQVVAEADAEAKAAEEAAAQLPDPTSRIIDLRRQVEEQERSGKRLMERRILAQHVADMEAASDAAEADHRTLDGILEAGRQLRGRLLDGVDLGVDGLEVGAGELRLGGVPWKQASMARRIRAAVAIAMRQNPQLRVIRVDEGERLDEHSQQLLEQAAEEAGFQVIYTRVASTPFHVQIIDREAA